MPKQNQRKLQGEEGKTETNRHTRQRFTTSKIEHQLASNSS